MTAFILSVRTITPVLLNRWLTLDAMLDGIQTQNGISPEERVLPLLAFDGQSKRAGMTALDAAAGNLVFCASAAIPGDATIRIIDPDDEKVSGRASVPHPAISSITFRGGLRPNEAFKHDVEYPFATSAKKFVITRGPAASFLSTQRMILPGRFEWLAQGDPDEVVKILAETPGIGAKVNNGFGQLDHEAIKVTPVDDAPDLFGIVDEEGDRLMRPVPSDLVPDAASTLSEFHHRIETCRPPYWDKRGQVHALVPKTTFDALLTR